MLDYPRRIAHWCGTDVLKLWMYPPTDKKIWYVRIFLHRVYWRIMWRYFQWHFVDDLGLAAGLQTFGVDPVRIRMVPDEIGQNIFYVQKRGHKALHVLYYHPNWKSNRKFKEWLYGYALICEARKYFEANYSRKDIKFIRYKGGDNLKRLMKTTDVYIRPNMHDGGSRLVRLLVANEIQCFHVKDGYLRNYHKLKFELIQWIKEKVDGKMARNRKQGYDRDGDSKTTALQR